MAAVLVPDALWAVIAPLLPPEPPKPKGGRPQVDDRACLTGVLLVLKAGIPWTVLPAETGCGAGMSCWRRLREWWQKAGVWDRLHHELVHRLGAADAIDWSRVAVDSAAMPAKGGRRGGAEPDRSRQAGTERHVLVDRRGAPLAALLSPANRNDHLMLEAALDAVSPVLRRGAAGPAAGRPSWTATRPSTTPPAGGRAGRAGSSRASRGAASSAATASAGTAGWLSARWRGCSTAAGACRPL